MLVMIRDKIVAECKFILEESEQYLKIIERVNTYFLSLMVPKNMDGNSRDNVIISFSVNFSELCIALQANGIPDPENMTIFKFYSAIKYFESKKNPKPKK
jgi:hypothetical protein